MKSKVLSKTVTSALLMSIMTMNSALALPYQKTNISDLTSKISLKDAGTLIGDHLNKNVVYVKPGTKKFKGKFYLTNGGIECQDLYELRKLTYRMPTEEEIQKVIDKNISYSPAFESSIGIAAKTIELSKQIIAKKMEVTKFLEEHKDEYGTFMAAEADFDLIKSEQVANQAEIAEQNQALISKLTLAQTQEEKTEIRAEHAKIMNKLLKESSLITYKKSLKARTYHDAFKVWAPYKNRLEDLTNIERNVTASLDIIQTKADESLRRSEDLINTLERAEVGYASTSYTLNVQKEIDTLNDRMNEVGISNYTLQPLTVFNVKLNPGVTRRTQAVTDSNLGPNYQLITYNLPQETRRIVSNEKNVIEFPAMGEDNQPLKILMSDLNGSFGGSQSFEMPVTQGAICGYSKTELKKYEYTHSDGRTYSATVSETKYESPAPNQPIFVQNVALRYNYYEKSEPIHGKCSLNVSQTSSYVRNAGKKTSWSWFKKSTHSWDDTKKNFIDERGISCHLTKSPVGSNPEESKLLNSAFEKSLYQDIFGMFLVGYAKHYNVTPLKPDLLSADSQLFSQIGAGVMNLCGSNKYCQIGGIVLKSLDELVGTRHTGSTSNSTVIKGKLTKDYSLETYMVSEGYANIEMRVCLDHSKCEDK